MAITRELFESNDKRELNRAFKSVLNGVPVECTRPSSLLSWSYLSFDFAMIGLIAWLGYHAWAQKSYFLMAIYVFIQGSFFWSLFVIGHDSGHGSFSRRNWENVLSGSITHSFLLVPFYSWKISHHKHHSYHNMIEKDETHVALPRANVEEFAAQFSNASWAKKVWVVLYNLLSFAGLTFILYLFDSHALKQDSFSHFNPKAKLFREHGKHICMSIGLVLLMLGILALAAMKTSVGFVLFLYFAPWLIFSIWIYAVTYLHHTSDKNVWFYAKDWHYLKGALQTVDYDYGKIVGPILNFFHHGIERYHVVHHLNPAIPHYFLKRSHEAIYPKIAPVYLLDHHPIKNFFRFKFKLELLVVDAYDEKRKLYPIKPWK